MDIKWPSGLHFYNGRLILNSVVSDSEISRVLKLIIRLERHTTAFEIILENLKGNGKSKKVDQKWWLY